ncbi:uncharacterized protein LOC128716765 [Anopheles marshallii]|uniref:uncharacterized protein LOC128716765 n=1 Tax=Anopheles marshallii TaxID=1521116 RepID=UPI00237B82D8|nr:uncharacterized protein LOC128716765 [Anopheles marshallii]
MQQGTQQQRWHQQDAVAATSQPPQATEGGSWVEVLRRKPPRQQVTEQQRQEQWPQLPQRQHAQWQQPHGQQPQRPQLQRPQAQQQAAASTVAKQSGGQQRQRKPKPYAIEIAPAEGQSWDEMYQLVRAAPELQKYNDQLGVGVGPRDRGW